MLEKKIEEEILDVKEVVEKIEETKTEPVKVKVSKSKTKPKIIKLSDKEFDLWWKSTGRIYKKQGYGSRFIEKQLMSIVTKKPTSKQVKKLKSY